MQTVKMRFDLDKSVHSKLKSQAAISGKKLYELIISILTKAANSKNGEGR
jgi:hypothetical protein